MDHRIADLAKADSWFTAHFMKQGYLTSAELCSVLKKPAPETEGPMGVPKVGRFAQTFERPTQATAIRCWI